MLLPAVFSVFDQERCLDLSVLQTETFFYFSYTCKMSFCHTVPPAGVSTSACRISDREMMPSMLEFSSTTTSL